MKSGKGDKKPRERPRLHRPLRWAVFIFIILLTTANIYFNFRSTIIERALPIITSKIEEYAEKEMNGWIKWDSASVDHWGRLIFENVGVGFEGDSETIASVEKIVIDIDEKQLLTGNTNPAAAIKSILLDGSIFRLKRDPDEGFNLSNLFKEKDEPFDPDKFPLRCVIRFENATVEYVDPIFDSGDGDAIRIYNLRGGVNLRNISDIRTGLLFEIGDITTRPLALDGRANLKSGSTEFTLSGEIDISKSPAVLTEMIEGLEIQGIAGLELHSMGNLWDDPASLFPDARITLKDVAFEHPFFEDGFEGIEGAIDLNLSSIDGSFSATASGDSIKFQYSDTAMGNLDFRAGWKGELAYSASIDITDLDTASVRSFTPRYVKEKLALKGRLNGSFVVFGTGDDYSVSGEIDPSPGLELVGIKYSSGSARFAWHDERVLIEDVTLHSNGGSSISVGGFIDLNGENEYRLNGGFSKLPLEIIPTFYSKAAEWNLTGDASGNFTYRPEGDGHTLDLRVHSDCVTAGKYGDTGPVRAALASSRGKLKLYGLAGQVRGGWFSAATDSTGAVKFAVTGIDGSQLDDLIDGDGFSPGRISCEGVYTPRGNAAGLQVDFALENPAIGELGFLSITGGFDASSESLVFKNLTAVSNAGGIIILDGLIPLSSKNDVDLEIEISDFDLGEFIPGRDQPPLSRTDCSVHFAGPLHDMRINASIKEHRLDLFGNLAYTTDRASAARYDPEPGHGPPVDGIRLTGKASVMLPLGHLLKSKAGDFIHLSDIELKGAIYIGKFPGGLAPPVQYRHILGTDVSLETQRPENAGLAISGIVNIDGNLAGPIDKLAGEIKLASQNLTLGLTEIRNFSMSLLASGASLAVTGNWDYPSGGGIRLHGPAGWNPDDESGFVDLTLELESTPIDEVISLAGIDVSSIGQGSFEGGGRIFGPVGNLALLDFNVTASNDSILFGMKLSEGTMEFEMEDGILEFSNFSLIETLRPDGGHCIITGSGSLYVQEASVLPQAQVSASISDYSLANLVTLFDMESEIEGRVDAEISYLEQENVWRMEEISLTGMNFSGTDVPDLKAALDFNPRSGRLENLDLGITDPSGGWLKTTGYITLGVLTAFFDKEMLPDLKYQIINLNVTGSDFDLGFIDSLLPEKVDIAGSIESVNLTFKGKPTNPDISGNIKPSIGPLIVGDMVLFDKLTTVSETGIQFQDGVLKTAGDVILTRGDAIASFTGDIDFRPLSPLSIYNPRYHPPETNFIALNMNSTDPMKYAGEGFELDIFPEGLKLEIIPVAQELQRRVKASGEMFITGGITIESGFIDASSMRFGEKEGLDLPLTYNLDIYLGQGCRLDSGNNFASSLRSGKLNLSGSPTTPSLTGKIEIAEGNMDYLSRTFTLQSGAEVSFHPLFGIIPYLKAEAYAVITRHPLAEPGAEPLIITTTIDAFMSTDFDATLHFTSNYPYSTDELLAILGYQELFLTLEEEGISEAFTSSLYIYPSGLLSRYVRDKAGFSRFELTVTPDDLIIVDLEREIFINNLLFTYNQVFGDDTNYTWGAKYRFQDRSYAGFLYEDLESQDRNDWVFFLQHLLPLD